MMRRQLFLLVWLLIQGACAQEEIEVPLSDIVRAAEDERVSYLRELDDFFDSGVDTLDKGRFAGIHFQSQRARNLEFDSLRGLAATRFVCNRTALPFDEIRNSKIYRQHWEKQGYCKPCTLKCSCSFPYRTADGSCNNLQHPEWGMAVRAHRRLLPAQYGDRLGLDAPRRRGKSGDPLPSSRAVTVNVLRVPNNLTIFSKYLSVMTMAWGQFLDHDITLTPTSKNKRGGAIRCAPNNVCGRRRRNCFPIRIPDSDPAFRYECMDFVRSAPVTDGTCLPCRREQMNSLSSYIDASMVYGNSEHEMNSLRNNYLMKTYKEEGRLPPAREDTSECTLPQNGDVFCMKAGDSRVNEVPNLGMLHSLFLQEHNRIATALRSVNYYWSADRLFMETRKIVGALIQHITFSEFLPKILSKCSYNKLITPYCYNPGVDATIANSFATAVYRFGHSLVSSRQGKFGKGQRVFEELVKTFNNPAFVQGNNGRDLASLGRWTTRDRCEQADNFFTNDVVDRLFENKDSVGLSLPALNIQRGRDHGLPPYNHFRKFCGLHVATTFDDLRDHNSQAIQMLKDTYQYVEDIDLFVGAMSENVMHDAAVGPLFDCLLTEQFKRLRDGDRFFHENIGCHGFTKEQLHEIKKITLSKIMCTNFGIRNTQRDGFMIVDNTENPPIPCKGLPDLDLSKWKDVAEYEEDCDIKRHKCDCKQPESCDKKPMYCTAYRAYHEH